MHTTTRMLPLSLIISIVLCNYCCAFAEDGNFMDIIGKVAENTPYVNDSMTSIGKVLSQSLTAGKKMAYRMATSSAVPGVYDMVNNGSTLGINVLSGLVKVDRVKEPGRPRALSVRVFGVPVFNRGFDSSRPLPTDKKPNTETEADSGTDGRANGSGGTGEEEELPIDP